MIATTNKSQNKGKTKKCEKMQQSIFHAVIQNVKTDQFHDGNEVVSLTGKYKGHEINFHGTLEYGYELEVDDFGKMVKGKWVGITPTPEQLNVMSERLRKEVERCETMRRESETDKRRDDIANMEELKYGRPDTIYNSTY